MIDMMNYEDSCFVWPPQRSASGKGEGGGGGGKTGKDVFDQNIFDATVLNYEECWRCWRGTVCGFWFCFVWSCYSQLLSQRGLYVVHMDSI